MKELIGLKFELKEELFNRVLPFWLEKTKDRHNGGFIGKMNHEGNIVPESPKGAIFNARVLWTFSAVYNFSKEQKYLKEATEAYMHFINHFIDLKNGGVYWMLDHNNDVLYDRKQTYALSFAIYALSEYYKASGNKNALNLAISIFNDIEKNIFDKKNNGYIEALSVDWSKLEDMRLSEKDLNAPFSMNTHLHIMEAYTSLFKVWSDKTLEKQLTNLLKIHIERIYKPDIGHLNLFFSRKWEAFNNIISFGHDIEAAWLMNDAAISLDNQELKSQMAQIVSRIANITHKKAITEDGSLLYEGIGNTIINTERHWWPQFEAMVGFMDAYEITKNEKYPEIIKKLWAFIKTHLQHPAGDYWWRVDEQYLPNINEDVVGPWKGPYHSVRGILEIIRRIEKSEF